MYNLNHYLAPILVMIGVGIYMAVNQKPLGIRNNNPLNIRSNGIRWNGAIGENKGYIVFESAFYGLRAAARTLHTYRTVHGLTTISQIINRWAPSYENNTQSYIDHVSSVLEVSPHEPLDIASYPELMAVMILHENGEQPYSTQEIINGFNAGFS